MVIDFATGSEATGEYSDITTSKLVDSDTSYAVQIGGAYITSSSVSTSCNCWLQNVNLYWNYATTDSGFVRSIVYGEISK